MTALERDRFADIDITNDFMFAYVMRDEKICADTLRCLLPELNITYVEYKTEDGSALPESAIQYTMLNALGKHSIRMDVYVDDGTRVYNMEMQTVDPGNLAKRTRFYSATIDANQLERGADYNELKPAYVIFICKFDPFGEGLFRYSFENTCRELPGLSLEDGSHKIFFNTAGSKGDITPELRQLLEYMNDARSFPAESARNPLIDSISKAVGMAVQDDDWRRSYMTFELKQLDARNAGRKEGRAEGCFDTIIASARNLIAALNITVSQALDYLGVPKAEQEAYLEYIHSTSRQGYHSPAVILYSPSVPHSFLICPFRIRYASPYTVSPPSARRMYAPSVSAIKPSPKLSGYVMSSNSRFPSSQ